MVAATAYQALVERGLEALRAGRLEEAEAAFGQVVARNPKEHRAWHLLAVVALRQGRSADAAERASRAVKGDRRNPSYLNTLGAALADCGRVEEAVRRFREATRANPGAADGHYNLGKALARAGEANAARDAYRRALALDPQHPGVHSNLALVLRQLGELDAALGVLEEGHRIRPQDEALARHLLIAYRERFGAREAIARAGALLAALPRSRVLRAVLARAHLAVGDWRAGWTEYLWRDTGAVERPLLRWGGLAGELAGRTVRVLGEQGLGDVLFFARFGLGLAARGASVVLECQPQLVALARQCPVFAAVEPFGARGVSNAAPGGVETVVLAGDLPALLGCESVVPALRLDVEPQRAAAWRERLAAAGPPPYLGVTWRAGVEARADGDGGVEFLYKEVDLGALGGALRGLAGTLVALQRAPRPGELAGFESIAARRVVDCTASNADLTDMAALICALDDYVGVSNTNMHVAAGVGKAARVLVPRPPEWRWLEEGEASPWFPGFRIYRQSVSRDWRPALEQLRAELLAAQEGVR